MNARLAPIIEKLKNGETIENYKEGGNSMTPLIKSRQPITLSPVDTSLLEKGDIVLCKVNGNYCTHLISALKKDSVQISNNHNFVNGWTKLDNVFGIVTKIEDKEIKSALKKVKKKDLEEVDKNANNNS